MTEENFADEILSDDELENVVGGTREETDLDMKLFCDIYGKNIKSANGAFVSWKRNHIISIQNEDGSANKYRLFFSDDSWKDLTRKEAVEYVIQKSGKNLDVSNYL